MAGVVVVEAENGFSSLYCPRCGEVIFDETGEVREAFCSHLIFFSDWIAELYICETPTPTIDASHLERLRAVWEEDEDASIESAASRMAELLPASAFVLHMVEPASGGGHDGSVAFAAFDLAPAVAES